VHKYIYARIEINKKQFKKILILNSKMNKINIEYSKDILEKHIIDFIKLYEKRPLLNNNGGMKAQHMFWVYFILKTLNPDVIIESGIWHGQSTWLIENVCPLAKIISIDPNLNYRKYISDKVDYRTKDFNEHDWTNELGIETCKNTLAFIDDHQNNYFRLFHAYTHNIGHIIFEDNYPTSNGDVLSLKKILSNNYHIMNINGQKTKHTIPDNYKDIVLQICDYFECPPVYLDTNITRWGDTFEEHDCKPAIYNKYEDWLDIFHKEQLDYTFIAYVKTKI